MNLHNAQIGQNSLSEIAHEETPTSLYLSIAGNIKNMNFRTSISTRVVQLDLKQELFRRIKYDYVHYPLPKMDISISVARTKIRSYFKRSKKCT